MVGDLAGCPKCISIFAKLQQLVVLAVSQALEPAEYLLMSPAEIGMLRL